MTPWVAMWLGLAVYCQVIGFLGWREAKRYDRRAERMFGPNPNADRHNAYRWGAKQIGTAENPSEIRWAAPPVGRRPVEGSCPSCGAGEKRYCAMDCQLLDPCQPH